ncbi:TetR/AcrR family transcriptional regulator [Streptomyces sp. NPDC004609]|uniref:TetR/AcrR family transcriptional regulator n=1 Tax=Streptomyces sp. NPDC004609 TaxID=3364704 RepID=UPI0036803E0A
MNEQTRERLRLAAVELFSRKGFHAVGIRELADHAGIRTATLYNYMSGKEDLLVDIMRSVMDPLGDAAREALGEHADPCEQLVALVEMHVWVHGGRHRSTLVSDTEVRSLGPVARKEMGILRDDYERLWRGVVARGVAAGVFEVDDVAIATTGLLTLATGVAHWYRLDGPVRLAELCALQADLALGLVRARGTSGPVRRADVHVGPPRQVLSPDPAL